MRQRMDRFTRNLCVPFDGSSILCPARGHSYCVRCGLHPAKSAGKAPPLRRFLAKWLESKTGRFRMRVETIQPVSAAYLTKYYA